MTRGAEGRSPDRDVTGSCPDCGGSGQVPVDLVVGRDVVDRRGTWTAVDVTEPGVDACRRCARQAEAEYQSKIIGGEAA